ncbi:MAG: type II secretion system protein N [Salinisphaera sp.]|jgi:general secretion pathway protein N|nr:type II secretion system protein N [Salinisphaera sp.]
MTRKHLRYIIVGLLAFVVGLVAFLPARVAAGWLESSTPVKLGGVTGTLFHGQASYVSTPSGGVDNVQWTLHPAALLIGQASAHIRFNSDLDGFSADVSRSLLSGATRVSQATGDATVGWLAKLAGYTFVPLSGSVQIDIQNAQFDDVLNVSALKGQITLANSRWELLNPPLKLGRVQTALDHTANGIRARIVDSTGPLAAKGHATLGQAQAYSLDLQLRSRAGADDRLKNILKQLGAADSEGWHRIRERGHL